MQIMNYEEEFPKQLAPEDLLVPLTDSAKDEAILHAKNEFGNRKKILVKNFPNEVSAQDIHTLFSGYQVQTTHIERSGDMASATITLGSGDMARDAIQHFYDYDYMSHFLDVSLPPIDAMLCVSNMPLTWQPSDFVSLAKSHGNVERCFLVVSDATGHSKGYGFVEYAIKDQARKAKPQLNGHHVLTHTLRCDWADDNHSRWDRLGSTCLHVDLALGFKDPKRFRDVFSRVAEPRYCQLALGSDGRPKGFGIVAYESPQKCELTWLKLNGCILGGQAIKVSFITPGHSGRNTYSRMMQKLANHLGPQAIPAGMGLLPGLKQATPIMATPSGGFMPASIRPGVTILSPMYGYRPSAGGLAAISPQSAVMHPSVVALQQQQLLAAQQQQQMMALAGGGLQRIGGVTPGYPQQVLVNQLGMQAANPLLAIQQQQQQLMRLSQMNQYAAQTGYRVAPAGVFPSTSVASSMVGGLAGQDANTAYLIQAQLAAAQQLQGRVAATQSLMGHPLVPVPPQSNMMMVMNPALQQQREGIAKTTSLHNGAGTPADSSEDQYASTATVLANADYLQQLQKQQFQQATQQELLLSYAASAQQQAAVQQAQQQAAVHVAPQTSTGTPSIGNTNSSFNEYVTKCIQAQHGIPPPPDKEKQQQQQMMAMMYPGGWGAAAPSQWSTVMMAGQTADSLHPNHKRAPPDGSMYGDLKKKKL